MNISNRFCIKTIKGNHYLYTWKYRSIYQRNKHQVQKYQWAYIGPLNGKKVQDILDKLPSKIKRQLQNDYEARIKNCKY